MDPCVEDKIAKIGRSRKKNSLHSRVLTQLVVGNCPGKRTGKRRPVEEGAELTRSAHA